MPALRIGQKVIDRRYPERGQAVFQNHCRRGTVIKYPGQQARLVRSSEIIAVAQVGRNAKATERASELAARRAAERLQQQAVPEATPERIMELSRMLGLTVRQVEEALA